MAVSCGNTGLPLRTRKARAAVGPAIRFLKLLSTHDVLIKAERLRCVRLPHAQLSRTKLTFRQVRSSRPGSLRRVAMLPIRIYPIIRRVGRRCLCTSHRRSSVFPIFLATDRQDVPFVSSSLRHCRYSQITHFRGNYWYCQCGCRAKLFRVEANSCNKGQRCK